MSMHLEPLAVTSRQVQMQFSVKSNVINMNAEDAKALIEFFYEKINQRETFHDIADIPGGTSMVINNDLPSLHSTRINLLIPYKSKDSNDASEAITHVIDLPTEEVEKIKKIFNVINLPSVSTIDIPEGTSIEILRKRSSFSSIKSVTQEDSCLALLTSCFPCFR